MRVKGLRWTRNVTDAGWRRITVVVVTVWLTSITFWSYAAQTTSRVQRRHDVCVTAQRLYDGEIKTVRFIGVKLGASDAQITAGLNDLRTVLGARPDC